MNIDWIKTERIKSGSIINKYHDNYIMIIETIIMQNLFCLLKQLGAINEQFLGKILKRLKFLEKKTKYKTSTFHKVLVQFMKKYTTIYIKLVSR